MQMFSVLYYNQVMQVFSDFWLRLISERAVSFGPKELVCQIILLSFFCLE